MLGYVVNSVHSVLRKLREATTRNAPPDYPDGAWYSSLGILNKPQRHIEADLSLKPSDGGEGMNAKDPCPLACVPPSTKPLEVLSGASPGQGGFAGDRGRDRPCGRPPAQILREELPHTVLPLGQTVSPSKKRAEQGYI